MNESFFHQDKLSLKGGISQINETKYFGKEKKHFIHIYQKKEVNVNLSFVQRSLIKSETLW